ncbi:MAG: hypothetical protein ABI354_02195 [Candidatus Saccharimonadales bacterium]
MNAYISISEENMVFYWHPAPNEQYENPPPDAICWVGGDNDKDLLSKASNKFTAMGFEIVTSELHHYATGKIGIDLTVKERNDINEIPVGNSRLCRVNMTEQVAH